VFLSGGYDEEAADLLAYQLWREEVALTFAYVAGDTDEGEFTIKFEVELQPQCFAAGTPVYTPEGTRNIEDLRPGDEVWTWNEAARVIEARTINNYFAHIRDEHVVIRIRGESHQATVEHPFLSENGTWITAGELKAGDVLLTIDMLPAPVESVERIHGSFVVYNAEVDSLHTYFVGPHGILAHNASAAALRKAIGILDEPLLDAHHIVARAAKVADGPRDLLLKVGITMREIEQSGWNGVGLPRSLTAKNTLGIKALPHKGSQLHSAAYNKVLEGRLQTAYDLGGRKRVKADRMIKVVEDFGAELRLGIFPK
jgi:hypothetical protein